MARVTRVSASVAFADKLNDNEKEELQDFLRNRADGLTQNLMRSVNKWLSDNGFEVRVNVSGAVVVE